MSRDYSPSSELMRKCFPAEFVELTDIPNNRDDERLNEGAVSAADLLRPILLAEIAPARRNLIDGNHRVAKARRAVAATLPAFKLRCPRHVPFLTSARAYERYVEYNSKVKDLKSLE